MIFTFFILRFVFINVSGEDDFMLTVNGTGTIGGNLSGDNGSMASGTGSLSVSGNVSGPPAFTGAMILPVTLLHFKATKTSKGVLLDWATATELNNDFFTIEKSRDGIRFQELATIKGAGNSHEVLTYDYLDEAPYANTYYRLNQTDFDGTKEVFNTISVRYPKPTEVRVFPTIVEDGVFYVATENEETQRILQLIGQNGSVYLKLQLAPGTTPVSISQNMTPGIYYVQFSDQSGTWNSSKRIIIR